MSPDGDAVTVAFDDAEFIFHGQWLHDAQCEGRSSRYAAKVFCQQQPNVNHIQKVNILESGVKTALEIAWDDEKSSRYPAPWLRVLAPLVAKDIRPTVSKGIISGEHLSNETKAKILDTLLLDSGPGIIKITDLPAVDVYSESSQTNNLVTHILKRLFRSVFQHSMRGPDETFKIASHYHNAKRAIELPNYDTSEILLPHTDHSHYDNPVRVEALHAVQGTSENTFIYAFEVLATLREEDEDLYTTLCQAPMILGRVAQFYNPPLFQTTVDTAVRMVPGSSNQVKAVCWNPHLAGYLLSPFEEFDIARRAHCKFQEIMLRDSHMVKIEFRPGDLYIWDNFRILHGREQIFDVPRLAVGQTVIEQVVNDEYRSVKMSLLKDFLAEHWLVQTPTGQLVDLLRLIKAELT